MYTNEQKTNDSEMHSPNTKSNNKTGTNTQRDASNTINDQTLQQVNEQRHPGHHKPGASDSTMFLPKNVHSHKSTAAEPQADPSLQPSANDDGFKTEPKEEPSAARDDADKDDDTVS